MNDQREAIRSNAKYLRNVRPIDPDEICTYVPDDPHPAVVRQHLREDAVDLGLLERDDGTFVPVTEEPVSPRTEPVRSIPSAYEQRLEDLLVERYGVNWHEDATGDLLRSTIRRFKSNYLAGRPVEYDEDVAAGYAIYHLPGYYAAAQYALDDLAERGRLGRRLRVLDIGAGVGGPAIGLCEYLPDDALLEYHAVEPSSAADILDGLLDETGRNVHSTIHRTTAEAFDPTAVDETGTFDPTLPDDGFDLVLACNVLSELEDPVSVARSALESLAPDGTMLAMAPADKNTSIQLREVERELEDERVGGQDDRRGPVTVYGPTVRLWGTDRPSDRGWTFDARPDLEVPSFQRRLDDATPESDADHAPDEFVNVDVQFSYAMLRLDGARRVDVTLETADWAKMAEMDRHVPNRIDLVAAKLSRSLSAGGGETTGSGRDGGAESQSGSDSSGNSGSRANPVFKISDGSESIDHYAVLTKETSLNRPLLEAEYGDLCSFERALALWNDDEGAYNLVVDGETIVDRIA
ncbi:class I SAM-dependent methyltransferase [Natrarchaeobius halalkaliphilus]|uniref:Class I SAM-dependent methyltransferase n=1 Tax=Natrarchaeobius halalkaliphilus TaxID=1679091 RepID=A0A3N6LRU0_9EURY|nr:class I SAM-dependent methyltransferase [Natrarchaeobius halalkaliphilus]RQG89904.1 class I SAM-dependent methyltransferase [Natrarchaeobius halalkaliphilus]